MKIEFDIPDFRRELKIEITLRRDGEVIYQETTSSALPETEAEGPGTDNKVDNKTVVKRRSAKSQVAEDIASKNFNGKVSGKGNMMDIDL